MSRKSIIKKLPDYTLRDRATIITQTPMRITLAGGGTDVLWYSQLKGGAWISGAINKYVFVFINKTEDSRLIKASHGFEATMSYDYKKIQNPIIKECLKLTKVIKGVELSTAADASAKSGLGGSGAFEVGLLHALHIYKREPISQMKLAEEASFVEIKRLKRPVGPQDQYIAAFGGINYFEIDTSGRVSIEPLNISFHAISKLENNLLYFRTGIQRDASSVLGDQKQKIDKKDDTSKQVITMLDQIKDLGFQAKKYLLAGKIDDFGATFHQHWLLKKNLSNKVSNPQIDDWYNEAMKMGALGGKIMGAGGGGWFVF
ncbi:hypothetical protein COU88_00580, partial [Candidatus Roizmanbacteria bacterium CG10_big_fil_rev_8_21_14_0_10_39_6]